MLRSTGIDLGSTGTRRVSVPLLFGEPSIGDGGGWRVAGVPSDVLTYRKVHLPPAGREVCRRVVQEELSYSLPFPVDHSAWDFTGRPGTEAWVVVAPQDRLQRVRALAGEAELDAEPLGYLRAAQYSGVQSALVIDFGASKTTFCALLPHQVEWVRVILRGGRNLTQKLSEEQRIGLDEAEELKRRRGCELALCQQWVLELLEEVMLSKPLPYDQVLICGGGAAMPGLPALLSSRLGREVERFPVPEPLSAYQHVAAFGAALASRPGQPRVRLQSHQQQDFTTGGPWLGLAIGAVGMLVLWVADMETRRAALQNRHDQQRIALIQSVQPYLSEPEKLPPEQIVKTLEDQVKKRRTLREHSIKHIADSFARIATSLRQNKDAELRVMAFEEGKVRFEGDVVSAEQAEKLRDSMSKVFPDLQQIKTRTGVGNRIVYEFEGKLPQP